MSEPAAKVVKLGPGNSWYLIGEDGTQQPVSAYDFWSELQPLMEDIIAKGTSDPEISAKLHELTGNDPRMLNLINSFDPSLLGFYPEAEEKLQNYSSPEEPTPVPADQIDGNSSQGTGPVADLTISKKYQPDGPQQQLEDTNGQGTASSPQSDSKVGGEPVVLFSGQFYHQVIDTQVRGRGLHFDFTRTYLSQTLYKGPLGYNWDHSYNLWLREEQQILPDGTLQNVVYRSTGQLREDQYVQVSQFHIANAAADGQQLPALPLDSLQDAVFQSPPGFFDTLEKSNGRYILHTVTGSKFEYNLDLYIERIVDNNGNEMKFEYENRLLTKITDSVGKIFTLEYDEMNRIKTLCDVVGGRKVAYVYGDNGDLEQVDHIFGSDIKRGTDYRYLGPDQPFDLQHNLIEIINPMGNSVLENRYGNYPGTWEFNRLVYQRSADGEYDYEYGGVYDPDVDPAVDPVNVPETFTRVGYPNCHSIEHWFNSQGNVVRRSEKVFNSNGLMDELVSKYRYNEDSLLIEEKRPDGAVVRRRYQREVYADLHGGDPSGASPQERLNFGNLVTTVEMPRTFSDGEEAVRRIVTEYTYYEGTTRLKSQKGPYYADVFLHPIEGQIISHVDYKYDDKGNLTDITYPDVRRPDGAVQNIASPKFVYGDYGLIKEVIIGSVHTRYNYFSDTFRSGFVKEKIEDATGIKRNTSYDVDNLGRVLQVRDYYGAITDIEYTPFDTIKSAKLPEVIPGTNRPVISYEYNQNHQLKQIKEELKLHDGSSHTDAILVHTFIYDSFDRLIENRIGGSESGGLDTRISKTVYNSSGLIHKVIDFEGHVTAIDYNERMLVSQQTRGYGTAEQSQRRLWYNASGEIIEYIDGRKFRTIIERDGFGRPHVLRDPSDNELLIEYDAAGHVLLLRLYGQHPDTHNKVRWSETEFRYDEVGKLVERIDHLFIPGSDSTSETKLITQYIYDSLNRIEAIIDSGGVEWHYTYDGIGRLTSRRDADGNLTEWHYDDKFRTITIVDKDIGIDESGESITQVFRRILYFDRRGLPIKETDSLGNTSQRGYDSRKLLTFFKDSNNHEFFTDYDRYGQAIAYRTKVNGRGIRTIMNYDDNGRIVSIVSPVGGETYWTYDSLNRVVTVRREGNSGVISYEYDQEDNIVFQRDENGVLIVRTYTPSGLLKKEESDTGKFTELTEDPSYRPAFTSSIEFKYTPSESISEVQNDVAVLKLRHDSLDRIIEETCNGRSISYRYDNSGRRTGFTFPNSREIIFEYSKAGSLLSISQTRRGSDYPGNLSEPSSRVLASISRIGDRPLRVRLTGHTGNISYDGGKRIVAIDWTRNSDGKVVSRERNLYGARGEWKLNQINSLVRLFDYDELSRLVKAVDYVGISAINIARLLPADSDDGIATRYNQKDIDNLLGRLRKRISNLTPTQSFDYRLNDNTNRLKTEYVIRGQTQPIITTYDPDSQDRYLSINSSPLLYDRAGNLLGDNINRYRYDAYNRLAEVSSSSFSSSSWLIKISRDGLSRAVKIHDSEGVNEFLYAGPRLIEWRNASKLEGQIVPLERPHQYAHLASNKVDSAPLFNVMDSILKWISSNGSSIGESSYDPFGQVLKRTHSWPAPFGFAGYWYSTKSNLYELAARSYHPRFGRFLQRDPAGLIDEFNLYSYSRHAPGTLTDYWGFSSNDINWGTATLEAAKTIVAGAPFIIGTSAAIAAGVISTPFALTVGTIVGLGIGISSFFTRREEAFRAGKTDSTGRTVLAAFGDIFGFTDIHDGATGIDAVTDRVLDKQTRSMRLGRGFGGLAAIAAGSRFNKIGKRLGTPPEGSLRAYNVSSISRPSYYNPIIFGRYVSPQGATWRGNVFRGSLEGLRSWRAGHSFGEGFRNLKGGGNYWHIRSHFDNIPSRQGPHSMFDSRFRSQMVLLGDAPYIAGKGTAININGFDILPENLVDVRAFYNQSPNRGGAFIFTETNAPPIGTMGGTPSANLPHTGSALKNGYRVIVEPEGSGMINIVTMYPE